MEKDSFLFHLNGEVRHFSARLRQHHYLGVHLLFEKEQDEPQAKLAAENLNVLIMNYRAIAEYRKKNFPN